MKISNSNLITDNLCKKFSKFLTPIHSNKELSRVKTVFRRNSLVIYYSFIHREVSSCDWLTSVRVNVEMGLISVMIDQTN